ncbi:hypothetical protein [Aquabacterium sp. J223]|uniref:hypothetical protein n=1 Tax=Aquabacterium sp. J223 TaxID=2898431 RepID=UPI0021AD8EB8|nr:hypothetical protein [Aquabacterium sp. J223]UUX95395.1 hypothetical protein LRS07_19635 [Aquabacterium sp. J223]
MRLQPRRPPGHASRKALGYASEICSLRGAGHSYAAIREALEDVGVQVSISTVRREVLKGILRPPIPQASSNEPASVARNPSTVWSPRSLSVSSPAAVPSPTAMPLPGRHVADAFMRGRSTNPLFLTETQG